MGIGEQFEFEKTGRIEPERGMNEREQGVAGDPKTTEEFVEGLEEACRHMSKKNRALEAEIDKLRGQVDLLRNIRSQYGLTPAQLRALADFILIYGELTNAQGMTALTLRNMADNVERMEKP